MNTDRDDILQKFYNWLKFYRAAGVEYIDRDHAEILREVLSRGKTPGPAPLPSPAGTGSQGNRGNRGRRRPVKTIGSISAEGGRVYNLLKEVREHLCASCPIYTSGSGPVAGTGADSPRLLIACDIPGREDVKGGVPFQGEAGNMLERMLRAIRIERGETFITCAMKCRPPADGGYGRSAAAHCGRLLLKEIEITEPSFILALGPEAACIILEKFHSRLISPDTRRGRTVADLRGRVITLENSGIRLVVTHSPASMLQLGGNTLKALKREAWHDLQLLEKIYHD